jgi:aconitate hydratase
LPDRATIANMAPEYGATCGYFPIDQVTVDYLRLTGRDEATVALVEAYARAQGLWRGGTGSDPGFTDLLELDLASVTPSLAGPKRPQDRVTLQGLPAALEAVLPAARKDAAQSVAGSGYSLRQGDVVIAAITSCTNTSNPAVMLAAGLLAQNAVARGLRRKPWVKTSLAPGSRVVVDYLRQAALLDPLESLGFALVGYGCTTCIGNSGPLDEPIASAIRSADLTVSAVLSGNRNFEGRIHPLVKANWLASPPLVVAFALAGTTRIDLSRDPLGSDADGNPVFLRDIWPNDAEVAQLVRQVSPLMFRAVYADIFSGDDQWQQLDQGSGKTYRWDPQSTYIRKAPFFEAPPPATSAAEPAVPGARLLALFGDSITTDHISPAGDIPPDSPAGRYLQAQGVAVTDFNSYGSRRGNHEVMMRGTFANIRLRNTMVPHREGGFTRHQPSGEELTIYDSAMRYREQGVPLVVVAGKEYGSGSSRDWAAKGPRLLGIRAVIAESFERIHRSNLIGMGILPLQFQAGESAGTLNFDGSETFDLKPPSETLAPGQRWRVSVQRTDASRFAFEALCRLDTANEVAYFQAAGILPFVLGRVLQPSR